MSTRKIKNAVNNTTGELIYFKGHAQATYMSDGSTVEDAIKNIKPDLSDYVKSEELEGYAKTSDIPSLEGYAKTSDIPSLEGYAKTEDIPSLDGYAKEEDIPSLDGYVQSSELPDFNEFAKTSDMPSTEGLATEEFVTSQGYLTEIPSEYVTNTELNAKQYATKSELAVKQDVISDIDTIRTNAANYKGTVTSVKINGQSKSPSSGVVDLGYINKQLSTTTSSSMTLSPNIYYRNTSTSLSTLTITLGSVSNSNIINEYFVEFTTSSSGTTVSLPSTIKWANGETPTFEASTTYQISIVNNLGVVTKFK